MNNWRFQHTLPQTKHVILDEDMERCTKSIPADLLTFHPEVHNNVIFPPFDCLDHATECLGFPVLFWRPFLRFPNGARPPFHGPLSRQ